MRVNKTWTWSFYSRIHHHRNEIALAANYFAPFSFGLTIGEWSWNFGIGAEDSLEWFGPFLSYVTSDATEGGYWTAGLSSKILWESV